MFREARKPIMPLTPYQDGLLPGNGVAYVFMSEVAQTYVSENTYLEKGLSNDLLQSGAFWNKNCALFFMKGPFS
jgi:hypothetical protein